MYNQVIIIHKKMNDISIYGALTALGVLISSEFAKFFARKYKIKVSSRIIVLFVALVVGTGYNLFSSYVPKEIQESITAFVAGSVGFSTAIYSILIKPVQDKMISSKEKLNA